MSTNYDKYPVGKKNVIFMIVFSMVGIFFVLLGSHNTNQTMMANTTDGILNPQMITENKITQNVAEKIAESSETFHEQAADLDQLSSTETEDKSEEIAVIAKYKIAPQKANKDRIEIKYKGKVKKEYQNFDYLSFSIPKDEILNLTADDPDIEYVDLDLEVFPTLDKSREYIQVDSAYAQYGYTGEGVKVAVIDTGIAHEHPAVGHQVVSEIDYTGEGTEDLVGHGTHVSCIIACEDETYRGVAPGADLYIAKVIKSNGSGSISDVIAAMDWAVDQGVDIINISLGASSANCGADILSETVNATVEGGVTVVASSGNKGPAPTTILTPGCAAKAITVGFTYDDTEVSHTSSRGPLYDGSVKPDILAPGLHIVSAHLNNTFYGMTGSSMAAPHIAGLSAMILEADPYLEPAEIKEVIKTTAKDLGYDENTQGSGLAQALTAIESLDTFDLPDFLEEYIDCLISAAKIENLEDRKDEFQVCQKKYKDQLNSYFKNMSEDKGKEKKEKKNKNK